jgi:prevent-host-death family protein
MSIVTIEEAQSKLPELIDHLTVDQEVVITRNSRPVAKLIATATEKPRPVFGSGRGKIDIVAEDDDHLVDFADYMP